MIPADRWGVIERLFGTLLEMPSEERRRALEALEDADVRAEVSDLLSTHDELAASEDGFLARLDNARAGTLLQEPRTDSAEAATIGHYRIVRRIGRGGMGIVYQAYDPRLDRSVALKLLPAYLNADPAAVRRLGDEARAASALDHPNIETVYEIGEAGDGRVFIAMAYYEGETLRERIGRGPLPVSEVVELGIQLAKGLSVAHRRGIVHRDIKPENLLVTRDGVLKIVDFGVAKVMREGLASAGLPLGTAAYMSPEQTRGEALDHRTDLWSAGVVLYEMLTGCRPFGGEGETLVHAIRNDPPLPLSAVRRDLPAPLVATVERCLEKDREPRFESADDLARDLLFQPRPRRRRARVAAAAAIPAVLAAAFLMRSQGEVASPVLEEGAAPGIAVLPFEVRGDDLDMWREGMVDLLSIGLDGAVGLRAIDSRTMLAGWRKTVEDGGAPGLERALDVARGTGAQYAVMGTVVSNGPRMRLGARIYSVEDGRSLGSLQVEGPPDSLFSLVDRLSIDVLAAIWQGEERPHANVDLTRITTTSLPALKAYLEGESLLRRADYEGAVAAYERAVAADSTFAFALYQLGIASGWIGDEVHMRQSYQRALRHADRLPEREALLLRAAHEHGARVSDVPTVIGLLREATRKYPDDADAWYFLGDVYHHGGEQLLLTLDESEKAFRKVVQLDPGFAPAYAHLVNNAFIHRPDSARAANLIDAHHHLTTNGSSDQENHIAFGLVFGDPARRRQAYAALDTLPPGSRLWLADGFLDHPRLWDTRRVVLDHGSRSATPPGPLMTVRLLETSLSQGRLRAALAYLEDPLMFAGIRTAGLYAFHSARLPVQGVALDEGLALPRVDSLPTDVKSTVILFYAGAYAADKGRWQDHAAAVAHLREQADRYLAVGDSGGERFATGASLALRGQGVWRRGDAERALPLLKDGQRQTTWVASATREALNGTIRWWLGELLLEMGRPLEAGLYFESFWNDPWAAYRLGPIYERLGDRAKAHEAYALVASAWKDADPELQPRVREARVAVQRLTRSRRE